MIQFLLNNQLVSEDTLDPNSRCSTTCAPVCNALAPKRAVHLATVAPVA